MSDEWIRVDLVDTSDIVTSEAAYGTQFLYMRVPALGPEEHAFSLAACCPSIIIKQSGDWTRRLHELAVTQAREALSSDAGDQDEEHNMVSREYVTKSSPDNLIPIEKLCSTTTKLICEIDGVYGNASPPWHSFSYVLFVGGGVGVTPWLPAMEEYLLCDIQGQTMELVWIGRNRM